MIVGAEDYTREAKKARTIYKREDATEGFQQVPGEEISPSSILISALQPASKITPKDISWLWNPMLANGKFHLLAARGGSARTSIACDLATRITTGAAHPPGDSLYNDHFKDGSVLFVTTEDDPEDTLLPRFLAAGGSTDKLTFLSSSNYHLDLNERPEELGVIIESLPKDLALVILDPVTSMTGDANTHIDSNVKRLSGVLAGLAMKHELAILGIIHFRKGDPTVRGQSLVDMVTGSAGWVNSSRIALGCFVDDKTDTGYLGVIKSNIGHKKYTLEYNVAINNEIVEINYQQVQSRNIESIIRELAARDSKESRQEEKQRRAINRIGEFFTEHGIKPVEQKKVRKFVKEMIGERISNDEILQAERVGGYKSKPGGKGATWLMHPPGCFCEKCASNT